MTYIYIMVVVAVGLFLGRNYIKGFLITYFENKNKKVKTVKSDLVYIPVRSSRVFEFSIEIDEIGDGKATISVVKQK